MAAFDPVSALFGGVLIGIAATLLLLLNGRMAGISGIFGDAIDAEGAERGWRILFLAGLVAAPFLLAAAGYAMPSPEMPSSWLVIVGAGLAVGIGTRLSGGCTSGHGICGMARLSPRSVVATIVFMVTAAIVVAVVRHGLGA
jgi:uncharacterized membrane protein YedE/YeeE